MANPVLRKPSLSMAKRKKQQPPRIIYLACEGTETEYWYFKSLSESLDEEANVVIRIYPDQSDSEEIRLTGQKGVKTDHKSLCAKAGEKLNGDEGIDEAWIVIDKDKHPGLETTFDEAAEMGVKIAFSSISFEHWLLLHFEKNDKVFEKSDCKNDAGKYVKCGSDQPKFPSINCQGERCVAGLLRLRNYLPDFDKSNQTIFKTTQPHHSTAFENAAWLRWRKKTELATKDGEVFEVNPFTNVDELLKSIYQNQETIRWIDWGESVQAEDLDLVFKEAEETCVLTVCNTSDRSQVILPSMFYLTDETGQVLNSSLEFEDGNSNLIIPPNVAVSITFQPAITPKDGTYLNCRLGKYHFIIEG
ncbi:MAG: RloB domain-containing protein [Saprospiraceae bacterium]|nr:RloB domain-containing protein [Saprospiraceae bacterium]